MFLIYFVLVYYLLHIHVRGEEIVDNIDIRNYLSSQNPVWLEESSEIDKATKNWYDYPFNGNGKIGVLCYTESLDRSSSLVVKISNSNLFRYTNTSRAVNDENQNDQQRVPVGNLLIKVSGKMNSSDIRIILYDGSIEGYLNTTLGSLTFVLYVDYVYDVIRVSIKTGGNEKSPQISFDYNNSIKYKNIEIGIKEIESKNYYYNYFQLKNLEEYSVVYSYEQVKVNHIEYYITISDMYSESKSSKDAGIKTIREYIKENTNNNILYEKHKEKWNKYFSKSYLSMSDKRLEGFYWIELYKMRCTIRCKNDKNSLIDNMGIWYVSDKYPKIEINYKFILKYIPLLTTINDNELFQSFIDVIEENKDELLDSVPSNYKDDSMCLNRNINWFLESECSSSLYNNCSISGTLGNLNLVSFLLWKYYQYTLNNTFLENTLYPILTKSTNYYLHFTNIRDDDHDGDIYHIIVKDTNEYDLNRDISLLRWSCNTIVRISSILSRNDEITTKCESIIPNLTNYTIDSDDDLFKYKSVDDLFMFYPLNMINYEDESKEDKKVIKNTINHFINTEVSDVPSSIVMSSILSQYLPEEKNNSMKLLLRLLDSSKIGLSTMSLDGDNEPDISSSLGYITALRNMILYSDKNNIVNIFPIRVNETKSVTFKNFRVENGFIISGEMREFQTQWINIKSTIVDGNITIEVDDLDDIDYEPKNRNIITKIEKNRFLVFLKVNESITLYPKGTTPEIAIHYVSDHKRQLNYWGSKNKPFPIPDFPEIKIESNPEQFDTSIYSVCIIFTLTGSTLIYVSISMRRNSRLRKKYTSIPDELE